jgi:hypothetical protein
MNFYPAELVTPPLALVALLGCPKLHPGVGEFLRSQQKPPINSLGVADPWSAARLFGERKANLTAPSYRTGILKVNQGPDVTQACRRFGNVEAEWDWTTGYGIEKSTRLLCTYSHIRSRQRPDLAEYAWRAISMALEPPAQKVGKRHSISKCCQMQAEWFAKHLKRRPAVAVLLLERYPLPPFTPSQDSCDILETKMAHM